MVTVMKPCVKVFWYKLSLNSGNKDDGSFLVTNDDFYLKTGQYDRCVIKDDLFDICFESYSTKSLMDAKQRLQRRLKAVGNACAKNVLKD